MYNFYFSKYSWIYSRFHISSEFLWSIFIISISATELSSFAIVIIVRTISCWLSSTWAIGDQICNILYRICIFYWTQKEGINAIYMTFKRDFWAFQLFSFFVSGTSSKYYKLITDINLFIDDKELWDWFFYCRKHQIFATILKKNREKSPLACIMLSTFAIIIYYFWLCLSARLYEDYVLNAQKTKKQIKEKVKIKVKFIK